MKKTIMILGILILLSSFVSAINIDDVDLLGFWDMDDVSGSIVDSSENSLPNFDMESISDAVGYQKVALIDYSDFSISFGGGSGFKNNSISDYFDFTNITMCLWMNDSDPTHSTNRAVFGTRIFDGTWRGWGLRHGDTPEPNNCFYWDGGSEIKATIDFNSGHFCCKYNSTHVTGYANATQISTTAITPSASDKGSGELFLGCNGNNDCTGGWGGNIDEVVLFNRSLTDAEILELFSVGFGEAEGVTATPTIIPPSPVANSNNNTNVTLNVSHSSGLNDVRYYLYFGDSTPLSEDDLYLTNSTPNGVNQSSGLVAYYPFNINNTLDYSYFGNNGTRVGAVWNATGNSNDGTGAFEFDGVDDYISIPSDIDISINSSFTITMWFNTIDDSKTANLFSSTRGGIDRISITQFNGIQVGTYNGTSFNGQKSSGGLIDNTWYFLVYTFESNIGTLYLNNINQTGTATPSTSATTATVIGARNDLVSTNFFNGSIDEVMIFNRSLSSDEINELFLQSAFRYDGTDNHKSFTTNVSDGIFFWKWRVQNITDGAFSGNTTQRTLTIDTVTPTITLGGNNNFSTDNLTIISNFLFNLSINISFFDDNLFQTLINITNITGNSMFQILNTSITGTTVNYSQVVDVSTWPVGNYTIKLTATDSHTANRINDYDVKSGLNYFRYTTSEGNVIKITSSNINLFTKSTTKLRDRYDFKFNYLFQQETYKFTIESYHKIDYIEDSNYKAHFVIMGSNNKGNWLDFENPNLEDKDYKITKIDDYIYEVEITANGIKSFTFSSLGGLNTIENHYLLRIGAVIDVWVFDEENFPNQINATATIGTQTANSTININGARLVNITQEITSLILTSSGFGTEEKTISITQTFHNLSFNMTPTSAAKLFFYDEESEGLITGETFSVFLQTTGFSQTFSGITDNPHTITGLADGLYKLKASSANYPERQFLDLNISNTTTTNLNIYLINNTLGAETTFNIVDEGLNPLEDVRVVFTRIINGTETTIAEEESDFAGQVILVLDENHNYKINFSKTNYEDKTINLEPTDSRYVIELTSTIGAYNQSVYEGITYEFSPSNIVLNNNTLYNFTFTLNSSIWDVTNCTLRLYNGTSILLNETSSSSSNSCFISTEQSTFDMTNITSEAIYELNSEFEFTVIQQYKVIYTYEGDFSLKNFLDDLSNFGMAGFDDFGRMMLALIVIFIITALAAQRIGFTNPEVLIFLVIAQVWFFSTVNWLYLSFVPNITGLRKYFIAILITIAGGAFVIEKFTK